MVKKKTILRCRHTLCLSALGRPNEIIQFIVCDQAFFFLFFFWTNLKILHIKPTEQTGLQTKKQRRKTKKKFWARDKNDLFSQSSVGKLMCPCLWRKWICYILLDFISPFCLCCSFVLFFFYLTYNCWADGIFPSCPKSYALSNSFWLEQKYRDLVNIFFISPLVDYG